MTPVTKKIDGKVFKLEDIAVGYQNAHFAKMKLKKTYKYVRVIDLTGTGIGNRGKYALYVK